MGEDAEFDFCFNSEVFDDFSYFVGIFINILLVIEHEWACAFEDEEFGEAAVFEGEFPLCEYFGVDGDGVEVGGGDEEEGLAGVVWVAFGEFG